MGIAIPPTPDPIEPTAVEAPGSTNDKELPDDIPTLTVESTPETSATTETKPTSETAASETEGNPEAGPEEEPAPERSAFQKIGDAFRSKADAFMAALRGERPPGEDDEKESTKMDKAKFGAKIVFSVYTTIKGYKGAFDAPAWFYQKFFTNPAERKRIKEELEKNIDTEDGEEGEGKPSAVEQKRAQIEAAVQSSKFLSPEKKLDLIKRLSEVVTGHDAEKAVLEEEKNEAIAQLLDEFITTRVKGTVALKEGVNTALHLAADASGMGLYMRMARSGTYGAVSLYERWQTVSQERQVDEDGNAIRSGSQMKEFMNGFKETKDKLLLKGEGSGGDKFKNFAKASGTVARFIGMSTIGIQAGLETDAGQNALDSMLDKFAGIIPSAEAAGVAGIAGAAEAVSEAEVDDTATMDLTDTSSEYPDDFVGPLPEDAGEFMGPIEFDPKQIELGTVHSGDGIIKVLERQMEADPAAFGYEGDVGDTKAVDAWAKSSAMDAARESGLIRAGGDTRLATGSIDKLAVMAKANSEGGVDIIFTDPASGDHLSVDDLRSDGTLYEHGIGPDGASTEPVVGSARPERVATPGERPVEALAEVESGTEVPRTIFGGQLAFETNTDGELSITTDLDPRRYEGDHEKMEGMINREFYEGLVPGNIEGIEDRTERLVGYKKILDVMERRGLGDSPEADFIERRILQDLQSLDMTATGFTEESALGELREITNDINPYTPLETVAAEADRINDIRIPGIGKIEFTYSATGEPSMDWENLSNEIGPGLRKKATDLLTDGWQDDYPEARVDLLMEQQMKSLPYMLLRHDALAYLVDQGHGDTPEADLLRDKLMHDLTHNAQALDADSPVVRDAMRLTGLKFDDLSFDHTSVEDILEANDSAHEAHGAHEATAPETPIETPDAGEVAAVESDASIEGTHEAAMEHADTSNRLISGYLEADPTERAEKLAEYGRYYATQTYLEHNPGLDGIVNVNGSDFEYHFENAGNQLNYTLTGPEGTETSFSIPIEPTGATSSTEIDPSFFDPDDIDPIPPESELAPLVEAGPPPAETVSGAGIEKASFGNTKFELPGDGEVRFTYNPDGTIKNVFVPGKWVSNKDLMREALAAQGETPRGVTEAFAQEDRGISGYIDGMPVPRDPAPLSGGGVSHEARDVAREYIRKTTRLYVEKQALEEMAKAGLSGTPEYAGLEKDIAGLEEIIEDKYR
jgi:hypothetical protein